MTTWSIMKFSMKFAGIQVFNKLKKFLIFVRFRVIWIEIHMLETVNSNEGTVSGRFSKVMERMRELVAVRVEKVYVALNYF